MNLVLQHLQFPDATCPVSPMYYNGNDALLSPDGTKFVFKSGGWIKTNTYDLCSHLMEPDTQPGTFETCVTCYQYTFSFIKLIENVYHLMISL